MGMLEAFADSAGASENGMLKDRRAMEADATGEGLALLRRLPEGEGSSWLRWAGREVEALDMDTDAVAPPADGVGMREGGALLDGGRWLEEDSAERLPEAAGSAWAEGAEYPEGRTPFSSSGP